MTCKCRVIKCPKCLTKIKPQHKMKDARRYCPMCGSNIGMTQCEGNEELLERLDREMYNLSATLSLYLYVSKRKEFTNREMQSIHNLLMEWIKIVRKIKDD